jgi:hypothetical protein
MAPSSSVALARSTAGRRKALKLVPSPPAAPEVLTATEAAERWRAHPLSIAEPILRNLLGDFHADADHGVSVRDANGTLLWLEGEPAVLDPIGMLPEKPSSIRGGVEVRSSVDGALLGTLDLVGDETSWHPHTRALIIAAARLVEAELAVKQARAEVQSVRAELTPDANVLRIEAMGRPRAVISEGGEDVRLSRRHSEIITMLVLAPEIDDMRLARELYGEAGIAMTARAELSRLRRILGDRLPSTHRRLEGAVETDFAELEAALDCDDINRAIELWRGELLPGSSVPLIVETRERLELRMRDLLLSRPGTALLKRWLQTGAGRDDIEAARELIRRLGPDDPAHAAAASRLRRLSRR